MRKRFLGVLLVAFVGLLIKGCGTAPAVLDATQTECGLGDAANCDFCWVIEVAATCPEAWIGDGDCDCGCQYSDQQDCSPAVPEPPEDTCPRGCRQGSVCCGFPFCSGDCIGSPCCG